VWWACAGVVASQAKIYEDAEEFEGRPEHGAALRLSAMTLRRLARLLQRQRPVAERHGRAGVAVLPLAGPTRPAQLRPREAGAGRGHHPVQRFAARP